MRTKRRIACMAALVGLGCLTLAESPAASPQAKEKAKFAPGAASRDPMAIASAIDGEVNRLLAENHTPASERTTDAEFLRRVSLDIIGRIPTAERVAAFLEDQNPDKRRKLIDELLADKAFGNLFGTIWYHLLVVPTDDNRRIISDSFATWLASQINDNRGWDKIVRDILTAEGDRDNHPPTVFWLSHVEGAKQRELKPAQVAGAVSQRFLGMRLQCAECHNHPFTGFKQNDFWSVAAFFGKTGASHADKKSDQRGDVPVIHESAAGDGMIQIAESKDKRTVKAKYPYGREPVLADKASLHSLFAAWCTSAQNEAFAKAAVNRMWCHLFGRGIVNPVDDFRDDNPPTHPEALHLLAEEFAASGFDLKHLIRCICNSETYQRSSEPLAGNENDDRLFSHMALKMMSPEVLFDSLTTALGEPVIDKRDRSTDLKVKRRGSPKEQFLKLFDTADERDFAVEYSHGIPQVLRMMNGGHMADGGVNLQRLVRAGGGPEKIIRGIFLTALSRPPTASELAKMTAHVAAAGNDSKAYADVMWILLNTSEFVLNH